jgi:hypothetical protein
MYFIAKRSFLLLLLVSLFAIDSIGQDKNDVLEEYGKRMIHDTIWSGIVRTKTYINDSNEPTYTILIKLKRLGSFVLYESEYFEVLKNENFLVSVDKISKVVLISNTNAAPSQFQRNLSPIEMWNLWFTNSEAKDLGVMGKKHCFSTEVVPPPYSKAEFCFNRDLGTLNSVAYWYPMLNEDDSEAMVRAVSEYIRDDSGQSLDLSSFSEQRYFARSGSKFYLKPKYANYKLQVSETLD